MIVVPIPSDALCLPPLPDTQALTTKTFKKPPLDGSLSVPEIYDWHYINSPEHPLFVYSDSQGEVKSILWPEAVRGVHTAARTVRARVPMAKQEGGPRIVGILAASGTFSFSCSSEWCLILPLSRHNLVVHPHHWCHACRIRALPHFPTQLCRRYSASSSRHRDLPHPPRSRPTDTRPCFRSLEHP